MNQVKQYLAKQKQLRNESPKQKAKKVLARGDDLMFGIAPKDQEYIAQALYQAIILNKKNGKRVSLCVPILDIDQIDLDSLIVKGSTCEALAKRTGNKKTDHNASLADVYSHYGMVYLVTEDHEMLNTTLKIEEIEKEVIKEVTKEVIREVEKEVIKEVKTIQNKASGIKEKDILKALDNTSHTMSKTLQKNVVESVLTHLRKELKL